MSTRVRLMYGSERYGFFTGAYAHAQIQRDALLRGLLEAQLPMGLITRTAYSVKLYKLLLGQKATAGKKLVVWRVPRRVRNCEYRTKVRQHFLGKPKAAKANRWKQVAIPRPGIQPDAPAPPLDGWQEAVRQARVNAQAHMQAAQANVAVGGKRRP